MSRRRLSRRRSCAAFAPRRQLESRRARDRAGDRGPAGRASRGRARDDSGRRRAGAAERHRRRLRGRKRRRAGQRSRCHRRRHRRRVLQRQTDRCASSHRAVPSSTVATLGCGMDVAMAPTGQAGIGGSTSLASAFVAGAIVAVRSYRPELTAATVEETIRTTAASTTPAGLLDASALFRAAGPRLARGCLSTSSAGAADRRHRERPRVTHAPRVCQKPRVRRVRRAGQRLTIRLAPIPRGLRVLVRVRGRERLRTRARVIRVRARREQTVSLRFVGPRLQPSDPVVVRGTKVRPMTRQGGGGGRIGGRSRRHRRSPRRPSTRFSRAEPAAASTGHGAGSSTTARQPANRRQLRRANRRPRGRALRASTESRALRTPSAVARRAGA